MRLPETTSTTASTDVVGDARLLGHSAELQALIAIFFASGA
jgi:hypothetical protein